MSQSINLADIPVDLQSYANVPKTSPLPDDIASVNPELYQKYEAAVDELRSILVLAENPVDMTNEATKRAILPKLSYGLRKAGDVLAWLKFHHGQAVANRKRAMAIASLDEYDEYVERKKAEDPTFKSTEKVREAYVNISPTVHAATQQESLVEAMLEQVSTMKLELIMSISATKAILYGFKDSDTISGVSSSYGG